jgi:2,3-bisphosphoglycerate-independent phosphoglycerate mutase
MDRDKRWARVEIAYNALVNATGTLRSDPVAALEESYADGITDEFLKPIIIEPQGRVQRGDTVIFVNFRPDRARELTRAFADPAFDGFTHRYFPLNFVCMTQYDDTMPNVSVAFPPIAPKNTFGEVVSKLGMRQLRIAETEKYAHVTFFFNGGVEEPFPGEERVLIPSPTTYPTYDLIPEMSAYEVCDALCERIRGGEYDAVICNFANCDMVGHTGSIAAAIKAVETVDDCVGRVIAAVQSVSGNLLITADHGNAEQMLEDDGETPRTAHTVDLVPVWVFRNGRQEPVSGLSGLCAVAPTLLSLMGVEKPAEWSGVSLL